MWLDKRPVYSPSMRHRRGRLFPWKTQVALGLVCLLIVVFGGELIRGYLWSIAHAGKAVVHFLQWAGICPR